MVCHTAGSFTRPRAPHSEPSDHIAYKLVRFRLELQRVMRSRVLDYFLVSRHKVADKSPRGSIINDPILFRQQEQCWQGEVLWNEAQRTIQFDARRQESCRRVVQRERITTNKLLPA